MRYDARVPQPKKSLGAKSSGTGAGSAGGQAGAVQRPFAVFDFDGTLVRWQLYHSIADKLAKLGYIDEKDFAPVRHARMRWKTRGQGGSFSDYERILISVYEQTLRKIDHEAFLVGAKAAADEHKDQVYTYTRELIKDLKAKGYFLLAISGSQEEVVSLVAKYWGFDDWSGSIYEVRDGKFTGNVQVVSKDKKKVLQELIDKNNLKMEDSVGVGDSDSDIAMLEMVENPIAFNPTSGLLRYARSKGWKIVVERKDVAYELDKDAHGYRLL